MHKALILAASLGVLAQSAQADGNGVVTKIVSNGGNYPFAEQFQTGGGPTTYCFSTRDPGYEGELRSETLSYMTRNYTTNAEILTFQLAPSNPDCGPATTVNKIQLGQ